MATPSTSTSRSGSAAVHVVDWGRTAYEDALRRQHELVSRRIAGEIPDTLALTEHDPVITLGRGAKPGNVLTPGCPVVPVERGGDATWHGPGQVVGYLVRLLPPGGRDLVAHLREIEALLIAALGRFGIEGRRVADKTGVWVETPGGLRKIASLGVAARRWCTYHGFALNVECDLGAFRAINPCGLDASVMTSVRALLGASPGAAAVKRAISDAIGRSARPAPGSAARSRGA